jgi:ATP-binding cassette subfamily F protein uup
LLDRVSTVVIGLDGSGGAGTFADYSQWEAVARRIGVARSGNGGAPERVRAESPSGPPKKLAYLEQREWDSMEQKILEAESEIAKWQR